jgi:hypothetical protein
MSPFEMHYKILFFCFQRYEIKLIKLRIGVKKNTKAVAWIKDHGLALPIQIGEFGISILVGGINFFVE